MLMLRPFHGILPMKRSISGHPRKKSIVSMLFLFTMRDKAMPSVGYIHDVVLNRNSDKITIRPYFGCHHDILAILFKKISGALLHNKMPILALHPLLNHFSGLPHLRKIQSMAVRRIIDLNDGFVGGMKRIHQLDMIPTDRMDI